MTAFETVLRDGAIVCATVVAMEGVAWAMHRYVMHGFGWGWHRSHHEPRGGVLERNDRYALVFGAASVLLFALAPSRSHWLFYVAVGITCYGVLYAALHDGLVHRRWPVPVPAGVRGAYLRRLIQAHRLHHAVRTRQGAVSFGFLYAPPVRVVAARLRRLRDGGAA
jgi:beta-carotene 3-hydroxylase